MGKELIIVESPAKVKTIRKFLGPDYVVKASVGHVRDLPSKTLGVDEEHGFEPQYQIIADKKNIVSDLQNEAGQADVTYLAPDPDREGEAIAWHIAELLKGKAKDLKRIQFNEITSRAVKEALKHPRALNADLFHAQQARRILDRLVGYKISPLLWKTVKRGISAGRVQSVALRLIVDREKEREKFRPEEYWVFRALLKGNSGPAFRVELAKVAGSKPAITCKKEADALTESLQGRDFMVSSVDQKRREKSPLPPFTTSTLQQTANQRLGYSAKRTMGIAQRLYEGVEMKDGSVTALITYMRTDSTRIADEAKAAAAQYIGDTFGQDYLPASIRNYKVSENAQDAHEAIRPVDVTVTPDSIRESLTQEQYSLYRLIWSRFVASQMAAAVFMDTRVLVSCGDTEWQARGQRGLFAGWEAVYPAGDKDVELPALESGEKLELEKLEPEQKFTQPPARYSEASLVRSLEELGIGRPSTYASIISTLEDRDYVELQEKRFVPTDLGRVVCEQLVDHFGRLMDVNFTAGMEEGLDRVAEGKESWKDLLQGVADEFNPTLAEAAKTMKTVKGGLPTSLKCPECGKPLVVKFGKAGSFLACTGYPECRFTSDVERRPDGQLEIAEKKEPQLQVVGVCPECGSPLVVKKAHMGSRFIACSSYPKCHYTAPYSTGVVCPKCGQGHIVEKSSRRGKIFYSCDRYPQCDFALWNEPVAKTCPQCGSPYLILRKTRDGVKMVCPVRGCGYTADPDSAGETRQEKAAPEGGKRPEPGGDGTTGNTPAA